MDDGTRGTPIAMDMEICGISLSRVIEIGFTCLASWFSETAEAGHGPFKPMARMALVNEI